MSILHRPRRPLVAGLLAVAPALAFTAAPAGAATVYATCDVAGLPSAPPADLRRLEVRTSGATSGPIKPGDSFSYTTPSFRFLGDLDGQAPLTGQYTARLESATVTATGATPSSASVQELPADLGTIDRSKGSLLRWNAPATGSFGSLGPFTATPSTRKVQLGLTFSLLVNYVDPNQPTFAPVAARLSCTTDTPIASVPVYRPATAIPTVAKVLPNRAAPGSWVYVYGRRLDSVTSVQIFGFGSTSYEILSPTTIRALVPSPKFFVNPGPFLPMRVGLTNSVGSSVDTRWDDVAFLYDQNYAGPAVTSVTPSTVSTQSTDVIWLEGSFLKGTKQVTIGGQPAPFVAINDSRVAVQTAPRAAGSYGLGLTAAAGTMPDTQIRVTYTDPVS